MSAQSSQAGPWCRTSEVTKCIRNATPPLPSQASRNTVNTMASKPNLPPDLAAVPAVLDIEASGFGRHSYPIEVGYVLSDGQAFCTLIRPEPEWTHWDPAAERLHHISRDLVLARGRPAVEVARMLNAQLVGQTVYSDG